MNQGRYAVAVKAEVGSSQVIEHDKIARGVALFGENICYSYSVKSEDDLEVRFQSYSGLSSLWVNP